MIPELSDLLDAVAAHRRALEDYRAIPPEVLQSPGGGGPQLDHIRFTRDRLFVAETTARAILQERTDHD